MKKLILATLVATIVLVSTASAVQNAGSAWNLFASQFSFETYPQGSGTTFSQAYLGSNFSADFAGILGQVGRVMNAQDDPGEEDLLNTTLENWPNAGL